MKVYYGQPHRLPGGGFYVVVVDETPERTVKPLRHHVRHSPDGFAWGYGGSGPGELARCLLIDALGVTVEFDERVPASLYMRFKDEFVAKWPMDSGWRLPASEVVDWVAKQAWK